MPQWELMSFHTWWPVKTLKSVCAGAFSFLLLSLIAPWFLINLLHFLVMKFGWFALACGASHVIATRAICIRQFQLCHSMESIV